jgi:hypothetical protein
MSMTRHGLLIAALLVLPLTGLALTRAGRLTPRANPSAPAAVAPPANPLHTGAGCRWRTCQPHHWRDCMLRY